MASNPALLLAGMTGLLGDVAKKAADDLSLIWGTLIVVVIAGVLLYFILKRLWGLIAR